MLDVWIVGKWSSLSWELQGVYESKELAHDNAKPGWFVARAEFNTPFPDERTDFPEFSQ